MKALALAYLADNNTEIRDGIYLDYKDAIDSAYAKGVTDGSTGGGDTNVDVTYTFIHTHSYLCYPEGYISRQWETDSWHVDDDGTSWRTFYVWHTTCGVCGQTFNGNETANEGWRGVSKSQSQDRYNAHLTSGRCTAGGIQCGKTEGEQTTTDVSILGAGDSVISATIVY